MARKFKPRCRPGCHFDQSVQTAREAAYDEGCAGVSGREAFSSYGAVSMPHMDDIGCSFPYAAPCRGTFLSGGEDWDLIALATYPNLDALLALFSNGADRNS